MITFLQSQSKNISELSKHYEINNNFTIGELIVFNIFINISFYFISPCGTRSILEKVLSAISIFIGFWDFLFNLWASLIEHEPPIE